MAKKADAYGFTICQIRLHSNALRNEDWRVDQFDMRHVIFFKIIPQRCNLQLDIRVSLTPPGLLEEFRFFLRIDTQKDKDDRYGTLP